MIRIMEFKQSAELAPRMLTIVLPELSARNGYQFHCAHMEQTDGAEAMVM